MISTENALRWLAHEARECRDRDAHEALCLVMPAIVEACGLEPMRDEEAHTFRYALKRAVQARSELASK